VHSRTCNVLILMCHGGVGSILVMFIVLDYYILYMCLLLFVYCIPVLEATRPGRQTKQEFKKNPEPRGVDVAGWVCHMAVMFIREPTNIRPIWHQGSCGTMWHTFVGQKEPTNVRVLDSSVPHGRRT
jgi:hypothetical protein